MCVMTGCIPAQDVPPQLSATAAPAFIITDKALITDTYTLTPPWGWRVIAGPAENPYTFQFVSPDNDALLMVSDRALTPDSLAMPAGLTISREQALAEVEARGEIYGGFIGHPDRGDELREELSKLLDSLR